MKLTALIVSSISNNLTNTSWTTLYNRLPAVWNLIWLIFLVNKKKSKVKFFQKLCFSKTFGKCPYDLDSVICFNKLSLYCAVEDYIFKAKTHLYLYFHCGYQATPQSIGKNCNTCMFFNDICMLDNIQRKTLRQYYIFFKTFINLLAYWQSLLVVESYHFMDDFFYCQHQKVCVFVFGMITIMMCCMFFYVNRIKSGTDFFF